MLRRSAYVLLNPGPVNTSSRVKSALLHHDICHRDEVFNELFLRVTHKVRKIFRGSDQHSALVVTGSGTAAMECAISSSVPQGKQILVIDNGAFGERLAEIATLHEMNLVHLRYDVGTEVRVDDVRRALAAHPDIAVVAMVHHETSVGLLNPVREIGALCRAYDRLLLVDAVSSLGAEDLDVVRDQIDVCWSSSNKCLHGVPGLGLLCVSPRAWLKIADVPPRVYYLDMKRYRRYAEEKSQTPFTPAVNTLFALDAACDEYLDQGAESREAMYAERNQRMRDGLRRLGFGFLTETGRESHCIVTARLPEGVTFRLLERRLKSCGFLIYDTKPPLQGTYIQIANMGDLSAATIDLFLEALAGILTSLARARKTKPAAQVGSLAG